MSKANKLVCLLVVLILHFSSLSAFSYVKGGVAFLGEEVIAPVAGIGQRYDLSLVALDFSWSIAASKKHKVAFYSSPRIAALLYVNPMHSNRIYVGAAASWAYIVNSKRNTGYSGLVGELIVGMQFESILLFQPFIEVSESFPYKRFSNKIGNLGHRASTSVVFGIGI
ncbi:MAG: hypothetical protein WC222_04525 [Parachlamydiales bacterium]|jgi:hypothetical protein